MKLVERAVDELLETRLVRGHVVSEEERGASLVPVSSEYSVFDLNLLELQKQGFFVPSDKPARLAQELRAVKRRLLRRLKFYSAEGKREGTSARNTVLVTSTSPEEGKTFTAINLALSMALEDNIKTLLVDADLLRPRIFHHLGVETGRGVTDKIAQPSLDLDKLVMRYEDAPLALLSAGQHNYQTEMLRSSSLSEFFRQLKAQFSDHLIILDAPPVLATPEAVLLSQYVEEAVFVIRASETKEPAAVAALEELLDVNEHVSLVLNYCLVPGRSEHYGSYKEYYKTS